MLQEAAYDVLEFSMPVEGMNQNISPGLLPPSFAYLLENIIAKPLGEGQVRFGTAPVMSFPNPELTILKQFPFIKPDGTEQILLYVQEYAHDAGAHTFVLKDAFCFSFTSPYNAARYLKDTAIKVEYRLNGKTALYDSIASLAVDGTTVTVTLGQNALPGEAALTRVSYATGALYSYGLSSKTLSKPLQTRLVQTRLVKKGLSVACVPRCASFMGKLLICNGVDRVLCWDGTVLDEVYDFVKEEVLGLNRLDKRRLSFTIPPAFNLQNYAVGNLLQIRVNGITTQTTIAARELVNQTLTLKTAAPLPVFVPDQTEFFYQAWPPKFSFLFVAHDRLWALGEGAAGLAYRSPLEAMRVYYAFKTNTVKGWFHDQSKTVPSIDLSNKQGEPDNLEAICLIGPFIAFMGRKKTQVYHGQNPLSLQEGGDFAYHATLPTGIAHGDLLVELPNDVFFISPSGLQSFSTLNAAKQFAATSLNAVDPLIQQHVASTDASVMSSDINYRAACSFRYGGGAIAGFKIGRNKVLCSLYSTTLYSWSVFSGDFEQAASFLTLGNRLYLSLQNGVYQYADGCDGSPPLYGDRDGKGLIPFSWTLPVIHLKGRRYANKRYELQLDYPSSFTVRSENQISIGISGDLPKSYQIDSPCRFEMRGDLLQSVPLLQGPALSRVEGGEAEENSVGFRLGQPFAYPKDRLKFMASQFWLTVSGYTKDGPLVLKKVKLYGIVERR